MQRLQPHAEHRFRMGAVEPDVTSCRLVQILGVRPVMDDAVMLVVAARVRGRPPDNRHPRVGRFELRRFGDLDVFGPLLRRKDLSGALGRIAVLRLDTSGWRGCAEKRPLAQSLWPSAVMSIAKMSIANSSSKPPKRARGWSNLLQKHGPDFLAWLGLNQVLSTKFDLLARALSLLLEESVQTPDQAREIWAATPDVLHRCNEQSTYEIPGAPLAYAWLHLLERYGRTWMALEQLVSHGYLPIAKFGINALDVGTGPGPSAFAVDDFYHALTEFGAAAAIAELKQPPSVTCVEFDSGTNRLRHHLSEIMFVLSQREQPGGLLSGSNLRDFGELKPREERRSKQQHLRWKEEPSWNPIEGYDAYDLVHTADEANDIAQSMHRYRLIVFSNFLTTVGTVERFEPTIDEVLADAQPGCAIVVLGAKGGNYPAIYQYVDRLANTAGFRLLLQDEKVSTAETEVANRVLAEGRKFYQRLQELSPEASEEIDGPRKWFTGEQKVSRPTWMRAYRKDRYRRVRH